MTTEESFSEMNSGVREFLSRRHTIPVRQDGRGRIPEDNSSYDPIRGIIQTGFSFRTINLLHAIGCKTASLSMSERQECLRSAYVFTKVLDLEAPNLCFLPGLDSDLQTSRSMELGIGMTCLLASRCFSIPWDQLESIPAPGKRFDYRASVNGLKCIFESKGTKYRGNQAKQIESGLSKKQAHHDRGEHFDIELIVSTHVGTRWDEPRIVVADPPFPWYEYVYTPQAAKFFRYRHFTRIAQYIGVPSLARSLYKRANLLRVEGLEWMDYGAEESRIRRAELLEFEFGGEVYLGRWVRSWVPSGMRRYDRQRYWEDRFPQSEEDLQLFQGLRSDIVSALGAEGPIGLNIAALHDTSERSTTDDEAPVSVFPDGTILAAQVTWPKKT